MSAEPLQQGNLFTGEWETKRMRGSRPAQTSMFSLNETFIFGAKAHPRFADAGTPTLLLSREDVRTPDEIERDLMRAAEELTSPMFASEVIEQNTDTPEQNEVESDDDHELAESPPPGEKLTKLSSYLALVTVAHEQAVTLWVDDVHRALFYAQLPQAILTAHAAGLTASEISTAIQIGEFQGKQERETAPQRSVAMDDTKAPSEPSTASDIRPHEGFRARYRREHIPVRNR